MVLTENVSFTTPALAECLRREIPVLVTWRGERVIGLCLPPAPHSAADRLVSYRICARCAQEVRTVREMQYLAAEQLCHPVQTGYSTPIR